MRILSNKITKDLLARAFKNAREDADKILTELSALAQKGELPDEMKSEAINYADLGVMDVCLGFDDRDGFYLLFEIEEAAPESSSALQEYLAERMSAINYKIPIHVRAEW